MVDYANPLRPHERLADRDRADAVSALAHARDEGRLTPDEFEQRSATARSATTWSDLSPLFSDLPAAGASGSAAGGGAGFAPGHPGAAGYAPERDDRYDRDHGDWYRHSRALGGAWGATIMSFMPFLALGLFFLGGFVWNGWQWSWLFFLLIPAVGAIIYGPGAEYRRRR
ncbi:DUF1707 SHOCT-like domain-containing protein [Humibacter albus]|jgi:hypothetical protein|uniref:DUF1707 SHOCT-like domain-containing protein n=1 Tax=Humibacter albus TaxID=427754 RepID=UPI0003B6338F|nr:DUF1707 domain-containing protein [Humibacter albus]